MAVKAMTRVGLDVHVRQTHAAVVDPVTGEVRVSKLRVAPVEVASFLAGLGPGVIAVYEAGPTGFGLARAITEAGMECLVAAPSKLQRPAGDRIKTDLLTELSASSRRGCVRRRARLARFAAREQRCGCAAGVVRTGGAAARFAGGDGRAVRAVSAC